MYSEGAGLLLFNLLQKKIKQRDKLNEILNILANPSTDSTIEKKREQIVSEHNISENMQQFSSNLRFIGNKKLEMREKINHIRLFLFLGAKILQSLLLRFIYLSNQNNRIIKDFKNIRKNLNDSMSFW